MEHRGRLFEFCRRAAVTEFKSAYDCAEVLLEAMRLMEIGREHVDTRMRVELGKLIGILKKEFNTLRRKDAPKLIIQIHNEDDDDDSAPVVPCAPENWSIFVEPERTNLIKDAENPSHSQTAQPPPANISEPALDNVCPDFPLEDTSKNPLSSTGGRAQRQIGSQYSNTKTELTPSVKIQGSTKPHQNRAPVAPVLTSTSQIVNPVMPAPQLSSNISAHAHTQAAAIPSRNLPRREAPSYSQYDIPPAAVPDPNQNYMPLRGNMYNDYQPKNSMEPPMYNWMVHPPDLNMNYAYVPSYQQAATTPQQVLFDPPTIPPPLMSRRNMMPYGAGPYFHPGMMQQYSAPYQPPPQMMMPPAYGNMGDPMHMMWQQPQPQQQQQQQLQRQTQRGMDVYRLGEQPEGQLDDHQHPAYRD